MSMQISNSSSFAATPAVGRRTHELRQDVRDLRQALRSGDLDAASSAYAELSKDIPGAGTRKPDSAFAQIGTALAAGDMDGAQTAFRTMMSHRPNSGSQLPTPQDTPAPTTGESLVPGQVNLTA